MCCSELQAPWGLPAGGLGGPNKDIDVKALYKWKLLFSTRTGELASTLGAETEHCEDVYAP